VDELSVVHRKTRVRRSESSSGNVPLFIADGLRLLILLDESGLLSGQVRAPRR
jgi:hypothetical protein